MRRAIPLLKATSSATVAPLACGRLSLNLSVADTGLVRLRRLRKGPSIPSKAEAVRPKRQAYARTPKLAEKISVGQILKGSRDAPSPSVRASTKGRCGMKTVHRSYPLSGAALSRPYALEPTFSASTARPPFLIKSTPFPAKPSTVASGWPTDVKETAPPVLAKCLQQPPSCKPLTVRDTGVATFPHPKVDPPPARRQVREASPSSPSTASGPCEAYLATCGA